VANAAQFVIVRAPNATTAGTKIGNVPAGNMPTTTFTFLDKTNPAAASYQVVAVATDGRRGLSAAVAYPARAVTGGIAVQAGVVPSNKAPPVAPGATQTLIAGMMPARVASFSPVKGSPGMSGKITIFGGGFARKPELAVMFTGPSGNQDQPATILARTDAAIDVQLPGGAKTGRILVETGTGADLYAATSITDFTVSMPIAVTRFSPDSTGRGSRVTIYGKNFSLWDKIEVRFQYRLPAANQMDLVPVAATNLTDASFDVLVSNTAVTGVLQVMATNGNAGNLGNSYVVTPTALKIGELFRIASFSPDRVRRKTAVQPGVSVGPVDPQTTISGQGFLKQPDLAVYFTGTSGNQDQIGQIGTKGTPS
jgi:hypothetical protein